MPQSKIPKIDPVKNASEQSNSASDSLLHFTPKQIREKAREISGPIFKILMKQAISEQLVRIRTRISFRSRANQRATYAYSLMQHQEFLGINARQAWSNWHVIPKNLSNRVPDRPLEVIDLCCGLGQSTQALAHYLHPSSVIHGLEFNEAFVEIAKNTAFTDRKGHPHPAISFYCQSVLESFRQANGQIYADHSVDLINSCGAVGHHFSKETTQTLAKEIKRVLKPGGFALIDSGQDGTSPKELKKIFESLGFVTLNKTKSCFADRFTQFIFRLENSQSVFH